MHCTLSQAPTISLTGLPATWFKNQRLKGAKGGGSVIMTLNPRTWVPRRENEETQLMGILQDNLESLKALEGLRKGWPKFWTYKCCTTRYNLPLREQSPSLRCGFGCPPEAVLLTAYWSLSPQQAFMMVFMWCSALSQMKGPSSALSPRPLSPLTITPFRPKAPDL